MAKIRAMAIAPYEGLLELMNKTAKNYADQMEFTSVIGDLSDGVKFARAAEEDGYDIIISRGGTSEMIMKEVSIPVINIEVSGYDYMRTIKIAQNFPGRPAMVGFAYITKDALSVNSLLQTDIKIITIDTLDEIAPLLKKLNGEGYSLIIGDVATERTAREMGLNGMLLTSGEESVSTAFEDAIKMCRNIETYRRNSNMFQRIVEESDSEVAIFNMDKELVYANFDFEKSSLKMTELTQYIDNIAEVKQQNILMRANDEILNVCGKLVRADQKHHVVAFYIVHKLSKAQCDIKGVSFLNISRQMGLPNIFRENEKYDKATIAMATAYSGTDLSVLISGEVGVGKELLAYAIHRTGNQKNKPFVTLDCSAMDDGDWGKLFEDWDSYFDAEVGATICVKNINELDKAIQSRLFQMLSKPQNDGKYRTIATSTDNLGRLADSGCADQALYRYVSQLNLYLPSLRERIGELKNLTSLYIMQANAKFGRQVIGLEEDALERLKCHSWMHNYDELHHVIDGLVLAAAGSYITSKDVDSMLSADEFQTGMAPGALDLSGTLDEITSEVIGIVLKQENGNLMKTAKRLGIGRSTLWRKIGREQKK